MEGKKKIKLVFVLIFKNLVVCIIIVVLVVVASRFLKILYIH